jgi:para-aminobenzoate synthetase component 1
MATPEDAPMNAGPRGRGAVVFRPTAEALGLGREGFERALDALRHERDFVLLDSRPGDARFGRYSFACFQPFAVLTAQGGQVRWEEPQRGVVEVEAGRALDALERHLARYQVQRADRVAPFSGGAVGYFGYELGRELEALPRAAPDATGAPVCKLGFYNFALVLERQTGATWLSYLEPDAAIGAPALEEVRRRVALAAATEPRPAPPAAPAPLASDFTRGEYLEAIRRIQGYIRAGDVYQVNMTQRFAAPMQGRSAWDLYRALVDLNPAPFAAYLGFGEAQVASSSPERFLRLEGREVETRPIKGTAPRGATPAEDARLRAELAASEKDRAELAMIVDVARNDLGRVCEPGSVRVDGFPRNFPEVETHAAVHHLVAGVRGTLREDRNVCDLLRAAFPGASITGAPKIRAMEIIDELERVQRGVYTGSIGYVGFDGDADLNVAIRTIVVAGGQAHLHAGGGIVADSREEQEYEESLLKARNLIRAVGGCGAGRIVSAA